MSSLHWSGTKIIFLHSRNQNKEWNYSSDKNDDDMTTTVRAAGKAEISKTEVVTKTSLSLLISEKYFQFRKEILLIMIQILSMRNSVHSWSNRNWKVKYSMTAIYKKKRYIFN